MSTQKTSTCGGCRRKKRRRVGGVDANTVDTSHFYVFIHNLHRDIHSFEAMDSTLLQLEPFSTNDIDNVAVTQSDPNAETATDEPTQVERKRKRQAEWARKNRRYLSAVNPFKDNYITMALLHPQTVNAQAMDRLKNNLETASIQVWDELGFSSGDRGIISGAHLTRRRGRYATLRHDLLREAEGLVAQFIARTIETYKGHKFWAVSILKSVPGARAQTFHSDYSSDAVEDTRVRQLPFSCVIPLHDYCTLLFANVYNPCDDGHIPVTVPRGMFVTFRGGIRHAGGPNALTVAQYRVHIYFACKESHVPKDCVYDLEE